MFSDPSPRTMPSPLPSPLLHSSELLSSQYPSTYPPSSQHVLGSGRPHPAAFPTPQLQSTHAPNTHLGTRLGPPRESYSAPSDPQSSRVHRSVTMPTAGGLPSNGRQVSQGHYPSHGFQAPIISPSQSHSGPPANHRRNRACASYNLRLTYT